MIQFTHEQQALIDWAIHSSRPPAVIKKKSKDDEWADFEDPRPAAPIVIDAPTDPEVIPAARHAILEARAGTGKTTTLLELARTILRTNPNDNILVVAFNARIKDEITQKAKAMGLHAPRFVVQTLHACGNAARMSLSEYRSSQLNRNKVSDLVGMRIVEMRRKSSGGNLVGKLGAAAPRASSIDPKEDPAFIERNKMVIESLVDFGRLYGVGFSFQLEDYHVWDRIIHRHIMLPRAYTATTSRASLVPDLLYHACEIIKQCESTASSEHDFVDMLWLPILVGASFKTYNWVMIDEAQDTNELSRAIAKASMKPAGGRMVVVGDPHQCINGFQGADDEGIAILQRELGAHVFPLTISQRCAKAIVEHAKQETSCKDIKARDDAPGGLVRRTNLDAFDWSEMTEKMKSGSAAVLCRNNAPLVSLGFTLMREGIPFYMVGGTDLYMRLIRLSTKWRVADAYALDHRLAIYRDAEVTRLRAISANAARIDAVCDEIDMLRAIIAQTIDEHQGRMPSQVDVTNKIRAIKDAQDKGGENGLPLSTVHKAKGLEWDTVYILGADKLMPSSFAITEFDRQQEDHILYVAITRARHELVYIDYKAPAE